MGSDALVYWGKTAKGSGEDPGMTPCSQLAEAMKLAYTFVESSGSFAGGARRIDSEMDTNSTWILDTGASFHMIDEKHVIRPKDRIRDSVRVRPVQTANDNTVLNKEVDTFVPPFIRRMRYCICFQRKPRATVTWEVCEVSRLLFLMGAWSSCSMSMGFVR